MERGRTKLLLFGGFLGSGKTTLIAETAKRLLAGGKRVGIITNDQGENLVDTELFRGLGMPVGEVPNGCFCCNFGRFLENIEALIRDFGPEYILAEPVGSCTDLAATIAAPLQTFHRRELSLTFFGVLADAPRLAGSTREFDLLHPLSPHEHLAAHQLMEAPLLLLSKIDLVPEDVLQTSLDILGTLNPAAPVVPYSAASGAGLEKIYSLILSDTEIPLPGTVPLDYELYARAEAEYGWYDAVFSMKGEKGAGFDPAVAGVMVLRQIGKSLRVAHAKIYLTDSAGGMKISLSGGTIQTDGTLGDRSPGSEVRAVFNIRALADPAAIADCASAAIEDVFRRLGIGLHEYRFKTLVPSPPKPTHRIETI